MRSRSLQPFLFFLATILIGAPHAGAGSLTYSHGSSALPDAAGPAITLLSITGTNDGTDLSFKLTFANPTIEGPSSGNNDAVYGFINLNTDNNSKTGVTGAYLDSNGYEPGFGQYPSNSSGIDAYISLTSEGNPLHGGPGLVDVVSTNGFNVIDTVSVTYTDQSGSTPSTLTVSVPLSVFSSNGILFPPNDSPGNFSVVVGNANNATDFLPSAATIPEPSSVVLIAIGMSMSLLASGPLKRAVCPRSTAPCR
jgi:hypothetical protein